MALTQVMEEGAESEASARELLKAEYELLCKGDAIKAHFDKWAVDCEVNIPGE
jgi:hypothetical protein